MIKQGNAIPDYLDKLEKTISVILGDEKILAWYKKRNRERLHKEWIEFLPRRWGCRRGFYTKENL